MFEVWPRSAILLLTKYGSETILLAQSFKCDNAASMSSSYLLLVECLGSRKVAHFFVCEVQIDGMK